MVISIRGGSRAPKTNGFKSILRISNSNDKNNKSTYAFQQSKQNIYEK